MIFFTGDMHGQIDFTKIRDFADNHPELTKDDYLVVCGDFGLIWNWQFTGNSVPANPNDTKWTTQELALKEKIDNFPFTTLFVDGNHENFDRLKTYPVTEWKGGHVQKISDSIIHLMRGEVYDIQGISIFAFGGAASHDRGPATGTQLLDEGICWWTDEICNRAERNNAIENLAKHNNRVDCIVTHCLSDIQMDRMGFFDFNYTSNFLSRIEESVEFTHWFCGHYHRDTYAAEKIRVLYEGIVHILPGDRCVYQSHRR